MIDSRGARFTGVLLGASAGVLAGYLIDSSSPTYETVNTEIIACANQLGKVAAEYSVVPEECNNSYTIGDGSRTYTYDEKGKTYYLLPSKDVMLKEVSTESDAKYSNVYMSPQNRTGDYLIEGVAVACTGLLLYGLRQYKRSKSS